MNITPFFENRSLFFRFLILLFLVIFGFSLFSIIGLFLTNSIWNPGEVNTNPDAIRFFQLISTVGIFLFPSLVYIYFEKGNISKSVIHYKIENYHSNNRVAGVYHYNEFLDNRSNRLAFNYQILQNKQVFIYSQLGLEWSKTTHEFNKYFEFFDSTGKQVFFPQTINNLPFHQNNYLLNAGLNIQYKLLNSMFLLHYTMQYHHPLNVNNYQSDNGFHRISNELGLTLNLSKFIKKIKRL
jgi:hypothetical protein